MKDTNKTDLTTEIKSRIGIGESYQSGPWGPPTNYRPHMTEKQSRYAVMLGVWSWPGSRALVVTCIQTTIFHLNGSFALGQHYKR